uniref:Carboxylic ester hydrolase n=1 Tax=Cuerna arida TaxID=1464854 RepID=A0A1B6G661_9HEMI
MEKETVVIQTKLGQLRGLVKHSVLNDKTYYAFLGVPFGKPPLGDLRFKAPQPYGGWEGIRDALVDGHDPKQPAFTALYTLTSESSGSEDCLYLNVYTNELSPKNGEKKPVLVSIPGGGFLCWSGSSTKTGVDNFMNGDVVVVSFNYRLGAFGFLSLENEEAPGNAGLKDQTLALKWVHENIDSFGGDPNNVTIFGVSAGGASVHFQLLCPPSKGLFHKAIIQCGFANNPWATQETPRQTALELAKTLGCTSEEPDEVLQFLKSASAEDIVAGTQKLCMAERKKVLDFLFTPNVEVSGAESSLPDIPDNLMKRGEFAQVPVILGCSVREGTVVTIFNGISDKAFEFINDNPEMLVPSFLGLKQGSAEKKEAEHEIWAFYFKGEPLCWDTVHQYLVCQSDIQFNFGMEQTRSYLVEKSTAPVYTYLYTDHSRCLCQLMFRGELSKLLSSETCHGADSLYTVESELMKTTEPSPEGKEVIRKHVKAWTNFATFGDPNHEGLEAVWQKDSVGSPCFLEMGTSWSLKSGLTLPDRIGFWKRLTAKYCKA